MITCNSFISQSKSKTNSPRYNTGLTLHHYRYILSQRIPDSIHPAEATLSLVMCCITYLCQAHHDPELLDTEIAENVLSGAYRLHDYAGAMWLELTETIAASTQLKCLPDELLHLLQTLACERRNDRCNNTTDQGTSQKLDFLKPDWPELHSILCEVSRFRQICLNADYNRKDG